MPIAALYDVHGNLPALEAVLSELGERDPIFVGGDVVAGPWPAEALERLRALGDRVAWVRGNADRELGEPARQREGGPPPEVLEWVRSRLSEEQLDFVTRLPTRRAASVDGLGPVLFCHATPRSDDELLTGISPDERWADALSGVSERTVVVGHTHVQFDRQVGEMRVVNAGSVGMPYEARPGAYWVRLGPDVEFRRTGYDVDAAAEAIGTTGWPEEWPAATPEEATEFFERISRERAGT
jgi:diadenosine tetraphosphatase ApaH/serine/threonine PP2A family protein phosphatase